MQGGRINLSSFQRYSSEYRVVEYIFQGLDIDQNTVRQNKSFKLSKIVILIENFNLRRGFSSFLFVYNLVGRGRVSV